MSTRSPISHQHSINISNSTTSLYAIIGAVAFTQLTVILPHYSDRAMRQDMLFPEEDAALLKAWIVKRIENTSASNIPFPLYYHSFPLTPKPNSSDADSDVLAEYVIALLKHDGNHQDIRDLCEAEIPDFLTEEPKAFLDDVFHAIQSQSYKLRAPSLPFQSISQPSVNSFHPAAAVTADTTARTAPKKRALTDRGDAMHVSDIGRDEHRSFKQPRRGGWRGMDDSRDAKFRSFYPVPMPTIPSGLPHIDPETPIDTLISMQAMGFPLSSLQPPTHFFQSGKPTGRQAKWKGRCRDFDIKGYCSRGSTCMYDHGNESIFVPPTAVHQSQGYDYNETFMNILAASCQGPSSVRQTSIPRGRGGRKTRGLSHRNHKKGLAPSSVFADGPIHDRSKSTVAIENIPEESFNEEHVKSFFSQFGNISQVSLQPHRHLAIVKFDNWSSANDAYQSPKVIFDNRFVKVLWLQDAEDVKKEGPDTISLLTSDNRASGSVFSGGVSAPSRSSETEVDLEEISRKQEDAQKLHLERQSRRQELERQRHELERQQQDLLEKHQAETEQLRARLAEKNSGTAASGLLGTEMLKAQLAALEREAKMLGLDPNAAEDISVPSFKGRGYRGKQFYRGKQSLSSRGRNSSSWDQGARHAVYAQYSIDNRPKKLAIHGVDFTPSDKDEALRHFLLNLGEFESIETLPTVTHVSFQDRKTAEKFFYSLHGQELAGVDGKLKLSWVDSAATPATALAAVATQSTSPSHDATSFNNHDRHHHENHHIHGGDNDSRRSSREGPVAPETRRQVDMDYEIGDDDAWGDGTE